MSSSSASDEIINLAVPKRYYSAIVQALAQLMQADSPGGDLRVTLPTLASTAMQVPWPITGEEPAKNSIDWSDVQNCRRLRSWLRNQAALTLLDLTAGKPDQRVYLEEVMSHCNCSHGEASSGNGALTKAIRKVFGFKGNWPAPFNWDAEQQLAYYVMKLEVADAWKASALPQS